MPILNSILDTIGQTPTIRINRLAPEGVEMFVKLEAANPGGSVKDRLALAIIEAAYSHLDPDQNPINMARKATEIATRSEYNRLQEDLDAARTTRTEESVASNDEFTPIINPDNRMVFIWFLELLKGGIWFALGTEKLSPPKPRRKADEPAEDRAHGQSPTSAGADNVTVFHSGTTPERKAQNQRYAIARNRGWNGPG